MREVTKKKKAHTTNIRAEVLFVPKIKPLTMSTITARPKNTSRAAVKHMISLHINSTVSGGQTQNLNTAIKE